MKIAVVAAKTIAQSVLNEKHLDGLATIGEVIQNETEVVDAAVVRTLANEAEVVVTSWGCPQFDESVLAELGSLRLVVHAAGTVKGIVSETFWERGLRISSGNGPLGIGVAETALGMTITSLKNMWRMTDDTAEGGWWRERESVREIYDVKIGVVGAGKAGSHYIRLLKAFDVDVVLYDPFMSAEDAAALGATKVELSDLLTSADVISIHAPAIPETDHLIDAAGLAVMKDDAILINTARGTIVDEQALVAELAKGRLFACLDVTDPEPPPADHPLRSMPNCVLTGHIAGAVTNGRYRLGRFALSEIQKYVAGKPLDGEVFASQMAALA
jgi:phosphoglycerate dehydrogenase-like enzyme